MTEQQRRAAEAQRDILGDRGALDSVGWAAVEEAMKCLPMGPTRREELCVKIRLTCLEAAARITVDMDPEVTLRTADDFVKWVLEGMRR